MTEKNKKILKKILGKRVTQFIQNYNYQKLFRRILHLDKKNFLKEFNKVQDGAYAVNKSLRKNTKIIFDIGAHYGEYSIFFSKILPNSEIYSFEPTKSSFKKLRKNIKKFKIENIKIKNIAFGDVEKEGFISKNLDSASNNISEKGEKIFIGTVDEFVKKNNFKKLDFIKCDVEGFEYFVFKGGINSLKKFKPRIFCEVQEKWFKRYSDETLFDLLKKIGYNIYKYDKSFIKTNKIEKKFTDYIFIPHDEKP